MSVVSESSHVAGPVVTQTGMDTRLRPAQPQIMRPLQPVVVVGTHLSMTVGFHHVVSADTEHRARMPQPNDTARVQRAADAQDRLQELLSQMRALENEAEQSTSGTEAGRASLNAQLEQLSAEAQDVANLIHFDDVHRLTTSTIDRVSVTRRDEDTYARRTLATSRVIERDHVNRYDNRAETRGQTAQQTRTVSVDEPEREHREIQARRLDHAREVMQRLVAHLDTQGIAFVAAQNYMPVGNALATLYAQVEHQTAWRPVKAQPAATVTPVQQTGGSRYI